jgi:hypothetical protein
LIGAIGRAIACVKTTNVGFWQIVLQKYGGCSSPAADEVIE